MRQGVNMLARHLWWAAGIGLAGCSAAPQASAVATDQPTDAPITQQARTINTAAGQYRVNLDASVAPTSLPTNADLKMAGGDLGQYAIKLCALDFANKGRPDRCEVFVQADKSGLLVGYATLQQGAEVTVDTAVQTDHQRTGLGCWITGTLVNTDYSHPGAKLALSGTLDARLGFSAWEKSPGDWMVVSGDGDSENVDAARGMWYFKLEDGKLRISQERWSYCYSDPKLFIDEVFVRAATLTRIGD